MSQQDQQQDGPNAAGSQGVGSAPVTPAPAPEGLRAAPPWERELLERWVMATVTEQRRARRWKIFFRGLTVALVLLFFAAGMGWIHGSEATRTGKHTAVVELDGVLQSGGDVDADAVISALRAAFDDSATAGVILRINSPGGSPVQAGLIADEVRRLRALHPTVPLHAVVEEICASGGYYVAAAADRIYVDKASLVGSIGVLMDGFGFTDTLGRLGIERRLLTAGENKGFLDPFSPLSAAQRAHAQEMLDTIHRQFIDTVKAGRGDRLKEDPSLFSGLVWTGDKSVELGLADALGSVRSVARDEIQAETLVDFTRRPNFAERLAKRAGMSAGSEIARLLGIVQDAPRLR